MHSEDGTSRWCAELAGKEGTNEGGSLDTPLGCLQQGRTHLHPSGLHMRAASQAPGHHLTALPGPRWPRQPAVSRGPSETSNHD